MEFPPLEKYISPSASGGCRGCCCMASVTFSDSHKAVTDHLVGDEPSAGSQVPGIYLAHVLCMFFYDGSSVSNG